MQEEHLEYKGEIYGRILEAMTWDPEEQEYQRFSNALFMAAKEDIIAEKQANNGRYTYRTYQENERYHEYTTRNLNKVINELLPEAPDGVKVNLRNTLIKDYFELKNNLVNVRVFGIGNNAIEGCAKACKMLLKTMAGAGVAVILMGGPTLLASIAASPVAAATFAGIAGFAGYDSVGLALNRYKLKSHLKDNAFTATVAERNAAKYKGAYKGEIYGRILEAMAFDAKDKEYYYLTNRLFMAAKKDIIAEKLDTGGIYNKKNLEANNYTENLDEFLQELMPNNEQAKAALKTRLLSNYNQLKNSLDDVRVLGVGNNTIEKCAKAGKILLKTMVAGAIIPLANVAATIFGPMGISIAVGAAANAALAGAALKKSAMLDVNRALLKGELKDNRQVGDKVDRVVEAGKRVNRGRV